MRPRLITAENSARFPRGRRLRTGFNEAAAHHRGERSGGGLTPEDVHASMRPRLITAENLVAGPQLAGVMGLQ